VKTTKLIALSVGAVFAALPVHAQSFTDLNFEKANPVSAGNLGYPFEVTAASAVPDWTVYIGTTPQTDVFLNTFTYGNASVDLIGPGYQTGLDYGPIDGKYSMVLIAGADPSTESLVSASIAQYGTVPSGTQSLQFLAQENPSTEFSVSFDGNNLTPVALGSGPNDSTLYGVNISSYAGDPGTLEFSALFVTPGQSVLGLDDIAFSPNAVPEPSIVALTAMGGLLFGARKWLARR